VVVVVVVVGVAAGPMDPEAVEALIVLTVGAKVSKN